MAKIYKIYYYPTGQEFYVQANKKPSKKQIRKFLLSGNRLESIYENPQIDDETFLEKIKIENME